MYQSTSDGGETQMCRRIVTATVIAVLGVAPICTAVAQERVATTVDAISLNAVANQHRHVAQELYFAKRSRVVNLDVRVLSGSEPFLLTLFPDVELLVQRKQLEEYAPGKWRWVGSVLDPRPRINVMTDESISEDVRASIEEQLYEIRILLLDEVPEDVPKEIGPTRVRAGSGGSSGAPSFGQPVPSEPVRQNRPFDPSREYTLHGTISVPGLLKEYRIRAVPGRADLSFIVERDQAKAFRPIEYGREHMEDQENRERRLRYQRFLEEYDNRQRTE